MDNATDRATRNKAVWTDNEEVQELKLSLELSEDQLQSAILLHRVCEGELLQTNLIRAVADKPIPLKSEGVWLCNGIRKVLNGSLSLENKKQKEMATAISRKISKFQIERKDEYQALSNNDKQLLKEMFLRAGAKKWSPEETLGSRLKARAELVKQLGMDFSATPSSQLERKLTSKELVDFFWTACGHSESRKADSINTSLNSSERSPSCSICRKLDSSMQTWYLEHSMFLKASGLDLSRLTSEDLLDSAFSTRTFVVGYGCGHTEETRFQSLKSKHKRAIEMGQESIACNACKVPGGILEVAAKSAVSMKCRGTEAKVIGQFILEELPNMNFDFAIVTATGKIYLVEIDGGFHYKGHPSGDPADFERRKEVDELKTATTLRLGHGMIRIDERGHRGQLPLEVEAMLCDAIDGVLGKYTVYGEECPGAARVSAELKGWK